MRSGEGGWGAARADPPWDVRTAAGPAAALHELVSPAARTAVVRHVTDRAVVLGRAQPDGTVDRAGTAAADVQVVRRASGGGAVFVAPGAQVWIDVFVPAGDPLADADVGRAAWWVGEWWCDALARFGIGSLGVHRGAFVPTPLSRVVCFAGLGAGEVHRGSRKLVGVAQRRTRAGSWFQTVAYGRWDVAPLGAVAVMPAGGMEAAVECGIGYDELGPVVGAPALEETLCAVLPGGPCAGDSEPGAGSE